MPKQKARQGRKNPIKDFTSDVVRGFKVLTGAVEPKWRKKKKNG
jgi:hypothetical protein